MLSLTGTSSVTLERVWINEGLNFLAFLIHDLVSGGIVSLLKGVLCRSMAKHDVPVDASLLVTSVLAVVLVLLLLQQHLLGLWHVFVGCSRGAQMELTLGLTDTRIAFLL